MNITAYWLNRKKKRTDNGKCYYFYPYTRCEIDDIPTCIIDGKPYIRIEVSEKEWQTLTADDNGEYNNERRVHNKSWTKDVPLTFNENIDDEEIDF